MLRAWFLSRIPTSHLAGRERHHHTKHFVNPASEFFGIEGRRRPVVRGATDGDRYRKSTLARGELEARDGGDGAEAAEDFADGRDVHVRKVGVEND